MDNPLKKTVTEMTEEYEGTDVKKAFKNGVACPSLEATGRESSTAPASIIIRKPSAIICVCDNLTYLRFFVPFLSIFFAFIIVPPPAVTHMLRRSGLSKRVSKRSAYSKCALSSSPEKGERYAGAISKTVLQPEAPSL